IRRRRQQTNPCSVGGDRKICGDALALSQSFRADEEESFVFLYRSAKCSSELITNEWRDLTDIEEVSSVQRGVTVELKQGAMKLVPTGLSDVLDVCSCVSSKFCSVVVEQNSKLADPGYTQLNSTNTPWGRVESRIVYIGSIQGEVVHHGACALDRGSGCSPVTKEARSRIVHRQYARLQQGELENVET